MKSRYEEQFTSIDAVLENLRDVSYIANRQMAMTVYLASRLEKPILVEGPAGVGKTELAKATAACLQLPLIRLQCYEGLDESKALYEWKYGKQLLYTQLLKDKLDDIISRENGFKTAMDKLHQYDDIFFSWPFLEPRPLLKALQEKDGCVLLIDEIDKSDDEFEAFLLEILSDFQVSVPEIGTVQAVTRPLVFLTSNNTREISEALKRRCLHLYIPFPEAALEREIIRRRVPDISEQLAHQVVNFIQDVRKLDLKKVPSISETIDWARVLMILHAEILNPALVRDTLNTFIKFEDDIGVVAEKVHQLTATAIK
ncbi:MAG TPA: MoxR family ATPase [Syntrophales bacterium]